MEDVEERMKWLLKNTSEEDMDGDTFAERAEWYYQKRPQLLALLQDLYNGYITLLDRSGRMEGKHRRHSCSSITIDNETHFHQEDFESIRLDWDAESSLSYQQSAPISFQNGIISGIDELVADLVIKNVEKDLALEQLRDMEKQGQESSRKIDLLKKLLEVLDSERVVLLNENVRLGYKVTALLEENKGLSSEAIVLRRKAGELARCVLKMREDHRVCMLNRKIEDLQEQIYELQNRNKEYYKQLVKMRDEGEREEKTRKEKKMNLGLMGCFQLEKKLKLKKKGDEASINGGAKCLPVWCGLHH